MVYFEGNQGGLLAGVKDSDPFVRRELSEVVLSSANVICAEFVCCNAHAGDRGVLSEQFGLPLELSEGGGER